jgi:hypothetical protein
MAKSCAEFLSVLFHARTQAHIFHLQTKLYARHKALAGFYDEMLELADTYAETYQGKYGIIKGYRAQENFEEGDDKVLPFFQTLEKYVADAAKSLPDDPDLVNLHADILQEIHHAQYKLKFLS